MATVLSTRPPEVPPMDGKPVFWMLPLEERREAPCRLETEAEERGRPVAEALVEDPDLFRCESVPTSGPAANGIKLGDWVLQVVKDERGRVVVTGPGRVLQKTPFGVKNGSGAVVFLQLPRRYLRRSLDSLVHELGSLGDRLTRIKCPTAVVGSGPFVRRLTEDHLWEMTTARQEQFPFGTPSVAEEDPEET